MNQASCFARLRFKSLPDRASCPHAQPSAPRGTAADAIRMIGCRVFRRGIALLCLRARMGQHGEDATRGLHRRSILFSDGAAIAVLHVGDFRGQKSRFSGRNGTVGRWSIMLFMLRLPRSTGEYQFFFSEYSP